MEKTLHLPQDGPRFEEHSFVSNTGSNTSLKESFGDKNGYLAAVFQALVCLLAAAVVTCVLFSLFGRGFTNPRNYPQNIVIDDFSKKNKDFNEESKPKPAEIPQNETKVKIKEECFKLEDLEAMFVKLLEENKSLKAALEELSLGEDFLDTLLIGHYNSLDKASLAKFMNKYLERKRIEKIKPNPYKRAI